MYKETAMTPTQIANNIALVALADMQNPEQALAASDLLMKTIPHLRNALLGDVEIAADTSKDLMHRYLSNLIHSSLFVHTAMDDTDEDMVSDDEIMNDGVADNSDDTEAEDDLGLASTGNPLLDQVAQLKEIAMGQSPIRNKGQFIPLDDIEIPDDVLDVVAKHKSGTSIAVSTKGKIEVKSKRINVMGKMAAGE